MSNYCEIRTATKPFIETAINAKNYDTNEELFRDAKVKRGDYISYDVSIINNSQGEVDNVNAQLCFEVGVINEDRTAPSYASRFISSEFLKTRNTEIKEKYNSLGFLKSDVYQNDEQGTLKTIDLNGDNIEDKEYFEINVGTMGPGETKTYTVYTKVFSSIEDNILKLDVTANGLENPSKNTFRLETNGDRDIFELNKKTKSNSLLPKAEVDCTLTIANDNPNDFSNLKLSTTLPDGIKFVSGDGFEYNEKKIL